MIRCKHGRLPIDWCIFCENEAAAALPTTTKPATHRHDWVHVPERRHACCAAGCDATEQCDCARLDSPSPTP